MYYCVQFKIPFTSIASNVHLSLFGVCPVVSTSLSQYDSSCIQWQIIKFVTA